MAERTAKATVVMPPALLARLDRWAAQHNWTRSTAMVVLIERGLPAERPHAGAHKGDDH